MSRRQKNPLRPLKKQEQEYLEKLSRSTTEGAGIVARAKAILAVADGQTYTAAAQSAGRRSGDAVSQLVARFNEEGLEALEMHYGGGGFQTVYGDLECKRILTEVEREPDREKDGTASWSIMSLRQALRQAKDGLPRVGGDTIWRVLRESGRSWQKNRTWKATGKVKRKRKGGLVEIIDPDAGPKKS
jgi:transposase